ncbi:PadR family transcriptional regulator [Myceligenerans pegani]|uniref:PadR family transcriptional regulator n=1 Tax=Myceligenerans pegani TaxID=2776917 RepID=A0ABR9N497_9MICO|nr:PadR family transcriptional regulator [Myceligenerans sp. TRM 65318]MBE1877929.1 PadR family transcriptional regulator [Myceligenerans sp. TRM 65318]MBE3020200.1 PadR family transcriptional regulator [Myceligenerans sp. TRM 65318]
MRSRTEVLEIAVLGLLNEAPLHGYELRKRLSLALGTFRALSYGSLYPALRKLVQRGLITAVEGDQRSSSDTSHPTRQASARSGAARSAATRSASTRSTSARSASSRPAKLGRRGRIVYELTADGKEHLHTLLTSAGPAAWEDENFDVRFSLFGQTDAETRLRILEGRRTRLAEQLEAVRDAAALLRNRADEYTRELQRFGQEKVEHEVDWIDRLIRTERGRVDAASGVRPQDPREHTSE